MELPKGNPKHLKAAAKSKQLMPLLDRLTKQPLTGIAQAHSLLSAEEREQWACGLSKGELYIGGESVPFHYLLGCLEYSEFLAGTICPPPHTATRMYAHSLCPQARVGLGFTMPPWI